jgi:hypothetical protein
VSLISISGTEINDSYITAYKIETSDFDSANTTRSESGYLKRERIRADAHKINLSIRFAENSIPDFYALISPPSFSVTYYDTTSGTTKTGTFYAGNKSADLITNANGEKECDYSVNFIEF